MVLLLSYLPTYTVGSESIQEAQLLLGDRATRKDAKDCWNGRGNDNLGWNDLQMYFKVIKSGTNRKLVYDFLLVVYSNFCRITHLLEKFDVKQSNDLQICRRSLTVVSPESCRVAMYVKCSENSEQKKRKSPFSTTPLSFDAPSPANPREYSHKTYLARNYDPWVTFLPLIVGLWVYLHANFSGWLRNTCV